VREQDKLDYLVRRRGDRGDWDDSRALLWFMGETEEPIEITLGTKVGEVKVVAVDAPKARRPVRLIGKDGLAIDLEERAATRDLAGIRYGRVDGYVDISGELAEVRDFLGGILLVDAALLRSPAAVERYAWPKLLPKRLDKEVVRFVREGLEPEAEGLTYVPVGGGYLALQTSKTTVRVDDLGDGVRNALLTAMLVLAFRPTVLLLEEPELHMHPGGLASFTGFLLRAARELGFQIIATTHSIEFVELARELAKERGLELVTLFVERADGILRSRSFSADDVEALRKLGVDVRLIYKF